MSPEDFERIKAWFRSHVASYMDMDPDGLKNIRLKEEHTYRVLDATIAIASGENLSEEQSITAAAVAILHDAGRFPQYRKWRTFRDSESDNHARLAVDLIRVQGVLEHLEKPEQLLIEEAIRFHNLLALPDRHDSGTDLFIRLIRDADKLDIWRVFLEYFRQPEEERASAASLGFPDLPGVTGACVSSIQRGEIVRLEDCRKLNDFRLLQISWVYDLNFRTTYRLLRERGYIRELASALPDDNILSCAIENAITHISVMADRAR